MEQIIENDGGGFVFQTWRELRMVAWGCLSGVTPNRSCASEVQATPESPGSGSTTRETRWGRSWTRFLHSWRRIHSHQSWLDGLLPPSSDVVVDWKHLLQLSVWGHWCLPALLELRQLVPSMRAMLCLHSQSCCLITFCLCSVYSPSPRAPFSLHFLPAVWGVAL